VVESQHQVSTRKLVDSADEQALLEELIDGAKPPDLTRGRLHYLLFTPFRYPPLAHGSRFGRRHERGIWYGSLERRTAFAEVAYYRLLFLEGTRASLGTVTTPLTAFRATLRTSRGAALDLPPFDAFRSAISSPVSYVETQSLGDAMRAAKVEAFRYPSARDVEGGVNVGAFTPTVFGRTKPTSLESWHCAASRQRVDITAGNYFTRETFAFAREEFLVERRLPSPAL
jgi:hypothetical protein